MRYVILICWSVFFLGCQPNTPKDVPPVDLIPTEQMEEILREMCKIEARFQRRLSSKNTQHIDMALANYASVFKKYQISEERFKTSYNYYTEHPAQIQALYDSVIVNLTKEQAELKTKENLDNQ